jgi:hypothetical protein
MVQQGERISDALAVESAHSASIAATDRFSLSFRLVVVGLWELLGSQAQHLHTVFMLMSIALPTIQYSLLLFNWWHTFHLYRCRAHAMRRGDYFFVRTWYSQASCNRCARALLRTRDPA